MLKTLYIENIAVIEKTSIDFSGGLNVLTGETGAGKSIIIDAINAIMGQRTSRDIIRTGEKTAFVSALFEDVNPTVQKTLAGLGFEAEDGTLLLQRSLSLSGKSSCKINGFAKVSVQIISLFIVLKDTVINTAQYRLH